MSSGDPHAPDMKKIKREDKDGHVIIKRNIFYFIYLFKRKKRVESTHMHARYTVNGHLGYNIFSSLFYFFFLSQFVTDERWRTERSGLGGRRRRRCKRHLIVY